MKYEIYSIREGFTLFKQQLEECRSLLSELSNLPDILTLQKNILFLSDMCKRQSLYIIEKTNVKVSLNACHSSLMNIKSEFLDDADKKIIQAEMQNIDRILNDIIASVSVKCDIASEEMATEENIKNTAERLEDFRAPAEFIQAYKDSVKLATAQSNDERLYQGINQRILKESALVKEALDAGKSFVRGSVTVNSQIKPFDLRGLDYSVLKIPGISFNHARREVITPIYVFHNQKLAIINVKKKKLSLKKDQYKDPDEVFSEKLEDLEKSTSLVNQTKRFHTPYLMSPLFKNVRFLWFSENLNAFKNTKDGEVKLLW